MIVFEGMVEWWIFIEGGENLLLLCKVFLRIGKLVIWVILGGVVVFIWDGSGVLIVVCILIFLLKGCFVVDNMIVFGFIELWMSFIVFVIVIVENVFKCMN